jgi:hypothetical protein
VSRPVITRRGALVAGQDAHDRLRPDGDLVDVGGSDLGLDHQLVGARHDLHDGLAVADYAPHGVHGELVHDARLRRAQVDALELVLGGGDALLELGDLALRLA